MASSTNDAQSAIDVLKSENERLTKELGKATSQADAHKAELVKLQAIHDDLKKQVGDPEAHKARAEELQGKLRTLTHKAEFAKVAKAHGAREEAIDNLYQLSGYKADKDDVDTKSFESLLGTLKETRGYAFAEAKAEGEGRVIEGAAGTHGQQFKPIPGAGRGRQHDTAKTGITLTKEQMMDPKFMLNPANKEVIADAAKNRRFQRS